MIAVDAQHRERRRTPIYCGSIVQPPQERGQHHDTATRIDRTRRRLRQPLHPGGQSPGSHPGSRRPARIGSGQRRLRGRQTPEYRQGRPNGEGDRAPGHLRAHRPAATGRPISAQQHRRPRQRRVAAPYRYFHCRERLALCPAPQHQPPARNAAALHRADGRGPSPSRRESHARSGGHRRRYPRSPRPRIPRCRARHTLNDVGERS